MPYIITTKPTGAAVAGTDHVLSRRAVATLEDAQDAVVKRLDALENRPRNGAPDDARSLSIAQFASLGKAGGTVGPLPDGTTITVELTDRLALAATIGHDIGEIKRHLDRGVITEAGLIDAYNVQQAEVTA